MTEMVDRIMRAMAAYKHTLPKTSDDAPFIYSHRKGLARVAIAAMCEPTEPMIEAGSAAMDSPSSGDALACWRAMIEASVPGEE